MTTLLLANPSESAVRRRRPAPRTCLALLLLLGLTACKTELYANMNQREANEMMAILLRAGIDANRTVSKDGTSTLSVDKSQVADAVEILKARGYPRQSFASMGDVFKNSGFVSSPTEERARFMFAVSEELSRTISGIDGVISARIHVVLPKNDPLRLDHTPSSASVFIRHHAGASLRDILPQVKMLVANSIEGLSYDKVSVVLAPVGREESPEVRTESPADRRTALQPGNGRSSTTMVRDQVARPPAL